MPKQEEPKIEYPEGRTRTEKRKEEEVLKEKGGNGILKGEIKKEETETTVKDEEKLAEEREKIKGMSEVVGNELTSEQKKIIEEQEREIEEAKEKVREMDNWKELQRKGLLTEKAEEILNKLEGVISQIDWKRKMLIDVREQAEKFKTRIERGEFDKGAIRRIPEETWRNPVINLEEREKEFDELKRYYNQRKEELRELEENGELEEKTEPEEVEIPKGKEEEGEEKEEEKKKGRPGIIERLFGRK